MYKITARIGNMILNGSIDGENLTEKQIQEKASAIFREAIVMNVEKAKLSGKEIKMPDIEKLPIQYEEILPEEKPQEPIKEKVYEAAKLDGLSRKELIEQEVLAERKLEQIRAALKATEEKEKEEIGRSLVAETAEK
jgi:hypothetical protein